LSTPNIRIAKKKTAGVSACGLFQSLVSYRYYETAAQAGPPMLQRQAAQVVISQCIIAQTLYPARVVAVNTDFAIEIFSK
jgi:hypothetical protein